MSSSAWLDPDAGGRLVRDGQCLIIDICPRSKAPVQLFVPEYAPCICVNRSSRSNVPFATAVHVPLIMAPAGIVIVNVAVLPSRVPDTVIPRPA